MTYRSSSHLRSTIVAALSRSPRCSQLIRVDTRSRVTSLPTRSKAIINPHREVREVEERIMQGFLEAVGPLHDLHNPPRMRVESSLIFSTLSKHLQNLPSLPRLYCRDGTRCCKCDEWLFKPKKHRQLMSSQREEPSSQMSTSSPLPCLEFPPAFHLHNSRCVHCYVLSCRNVLPYPLSAKRTRIGGYLRSLQQKESDSARI